MRVGVIDIGSNSVLLLIAEQAGSGWRVLTDQARITRLGEGFNESRVLQPQAVARTLDAVRAYLEVCEAMGATHRVAFGTAVVREARNPEALLEPLRTLAPDMRVWVLTEAEEAELSFLSVACDPKFRGSGALAVVDVGGGSVEVSIGRETLEWSRSFPVGALRLREQFGENPDAVRAHLKTALTPLSEAPPVQSVVSIGGTGVNLALLAGGYVVFEAELVHGAILTQTQLVSLTDRLFALSESQRRALPGIEPERAPLLPIGALILQGVLEKLQQTALRVSVRGVRYGVLERLEQFIG